MISIEKVKEDLEKSLEQIHKDRKAMAKRVNNALDRLGVELTQAATVLKVKYTDVPPVLLALLQDTQDDIFNRTRQLWIINRRWSDEAKQARKDERKANE